MSANRPKPAFRTVDFLREIPEPRRERCPNFSFFFFWVTLRDTDDDVDDDLADDLAEDGDELAPGEANESGWRGRGNVRARRDLSSSGSTLALGSDVGEDEEKFDDVDDDDDEGVGMANPGNFPKLTELPG